MAAACWLKSARAAFALELVGSWQADGLSDRETGCGVSSDDNERLRITIKDSTSGYNLKDCKASLTGSGKQTIHQRDCTDRNHNLRATKGAVKVGGKRRGWMGKQVEAMTRAEKR